jgi:NAD(P) transhydrogenase
MRMSPKLLQRHQRFLVCACPSSQPFNIHTIITSGIPYASLTVGAPRETFPNERRVSLTPQNVTLLKKKGFVNVLVEKHAGKEAQFLDEEYVAAGATMVSRDELFGNTDIMLKVRPPSVDKEAKTLKEGSTVISFLYPAQNKAVVDALATRKVNAFAMDMVPRISRAQTFDALRLASSISGHGQTRVNQPFTARWLILLATRLS